MSLSRAHKLRQEPIRVSVSGGHQIHVTRLHAGGDEAHARVQLFLLPGIGQDSLTWQEGPDAWPLRVAHGGIDVYLADTRGKGRSLPVTTSHSDWGLHALVEEEIPALLRAARNRQQDEPWIWVGEGFSGLLLLAAAARHPELLEGVHGILLLQSARPVSANFHWNVVVQGAGRIACKLAGYAQGAWLTSGTVPEARRRFFECADWQVAADWLDPEDGFDYAQALMKLSLPPTLHVAVEGDKRVPADAVRRFVRALPPHNARLLVTSADVLREWRQGAVASHPDAAGAEEPAPENSLGENVADWMYDILAQRVRPPACRLNPIP